MDLGRFLDDRGVLTVLPGGSVVDPYFSIKALLCGQQLGLDVGHAARALMAWLLPRQREDGRWDRYCLEGDAWIACRSADADDALAAVALELMTRRAAIDGTQPGWGRAADRAFALLEALRAPEGGYVVSRSLPVLLLMDNCEIWQSLDAVARLGRAAGWSRLAAVAGRRAAALREAIVRRFWIAHEGRWGVSSQPREAGDFYPDATGQLFPLLCGLEGQPGVPVLDVDRWAAFHAEAWLGGKADPYPWGLVALAMRQTGREALVARWQAVARQARLGPRWNVLEEVIFQGLA